MEQSEIEFDSEELVNRTEEFSGGNKIKLRKYQQECVDSIFKEFEDNQSTLAVLPTGAGKTQIFCEVARRMPGRSIILVHRAELAFQAANRLQGFGLETGIDMAELNAGENFWNKPQCIVATVQTLASGKNGGRRTNHDPEDFDLVICDEAHHFCAVQFKSSIDYFRNGNPKIKILGVTATPDRSDELALGQIFETVAYDYEILDAIHDGYLVPIEQKFVQIDGLDFSSIRTTAGDLNGGDLAKVVEMEKVIQGMTGSTIDIIGDKRTLVFTASVAQAEAMCDIFNRHKPNISEWIHGGTPKEERSEKLERFGNGKTQIMVNCSILLEGYDNPGIEVVVMAKPTKSRSLYCQMVGRSCRPLTGVIDNRETPELRKTAIAESDKCKCIILDFVGNSGRHKLMTTADILGGKESDEVLDKAVENLKKKGGGRIDEEIESVKQQIAEDIEKRKLMEAARKSKIIAAVKYVTRNISPFEAYDLMPAKERGWDIGKSLSEKQSNVLRKLGVDPGTIPYAQAKQLLNHQFDRWKKGLCTIKQAKLLKNHGYVTHDLTLKQASDLITRLAANNWRRVEPYENIH